MKKEGEEGRTAAKGGVMTLGETSEKENRMPHLRSAVVAIALFVQLFLPVSGSFAQTVQPRPNQEGKKGRTGNDLLSDCTYMVRIFDGDTQLTSEEIVTGYYCGAYLKGFVDGYETRGLVDKTVLGSSHPFFCLPEGSLAGDQLVRIVVKWLREHPERLHEPDMALAVKALEDAFPCKS